MTRVKSSVQKRARHKKVLKAAKGYFGSKHRLFKTAKEQLMHSGQYAYRDRRQKKRDFRKLWITRINAACRENEISYSRFIEGLTKRGIEVNRKMLSELAISDMDAFKKFVDEANLGLEGKIVESKVETTTEVEVVKSANKEEKAVKEVKEEKTVKAEKKETVKKVEPKKEVEKEVVKKTAPKKETVKKATKKEEK